MAIETANILKFFDKYWDSEKVNFLLFVAVILDPRYRLKYVTLWFDRLHKNDIAGDIAGDMTRKVKNALLYLYEWYDDNKPSNVSSQSANESSKFGLVNDGKKEWLDFVTSHFNKHIESKDNLGAKSEVERLNSHEVADEDNNFNLLGRWKNNGTKYAILLIWHERYLRFSCLPLL